MVQLLMVDTTGVYAPTWPVETQAVESRQQFSSPRVGTYLCSAEFLVKHIDAAEGREILDRYFT